MSVSDITLSDMQHSLSLLYEFMLYLTLKNFLHMNVFINTLYCCKSTFMNWVLFALNLKNSLSLTFVP